MVAFWAVAVLFMTDVAVVSGWLATGGRAVAAQPAALAPTASPTPTSSASAAPTAPPVDRWTPVTTASGASLEFPAAAQRSEQVLDFSGSPGGQELWAATTTDGATFTLAVATYPDNVDVSDPAVNLLASVSGAAGNVGGRVIDQVATLADGAPGLDYTIETAGVVLRGRNVLDGDVLYQQSIAYTGTEAPPASDRFLESLRLPRP